MSGWADTNGDGVGDVGTFDTDGDEVVDTVLLDADRDRVVDTRATDTDGDGIIDSSEVDTDRDGRIDEVITDSDGDGVEDTILRDRGDGVFETVMEPGPTDPRDAIMDATIVSAPTNPDPLMEQLNNPDLTPESRRLIEEFYATQKRMGEAWL